MDLNETNSPVLSSESNSAFSIYHQNTRGLKDKFDKLICSLIGYNIQPHLICLSEHYMTELTLCTLRLENYNLAANFLGNNYTGGGGVCVCVCVFFLEQIYKSKPLIYPDFVLKRNLKYALFNLN
jgi:hypothetical protein